jgi:hypothetical protein
MTLSRQPFHLFEARNAPFRAFSSLKLFSFVHHRSPRPLVILNAEALGSWQALRFRHSGLEPDENV